MSIQLPKQGEIKSMTEQEFAAKAQSMLAMLDITQAFFKKAMKKDIDYGKIKGTDKPTLLKPGAEKLLELYGYAGVIKPGSLVEVKNYETGFYEVTLTVQIIDRKTGQVIAEGVGHANTYENRYRYRWVYSNDVPEGLERTKLKSRTVASRKTGKEYIQYRIENDDLFTCWNTILKMAKKRALVDATLQATRSSGIFTQDEEDLADWIESASDLDSYETEVEEEAEETGVPEPRSATNEDPITELQQRKIWSLVQDKGSSEEERAAYLGLTFKNRLKVKNIRGQWIIETSKKEASKIINELERGGKK